MVSVNQPSSSMAMVPPMISGRASWRASIGCDMNVPEALRVLEPALDDLDEARVVGPAVEHHDRVVAVVEASRRRRSSG